MFHWPSQTGIVVFPLCCTRPITDGRLIIIDGGNRQLDPLLPVGGRSRLGFLWDPYNPNTPPRGCDGQRLGFGAIDLESCVTREMGHSNVWNSHPKNYGPGSRVWWAISLVSATILRIWCLSSIDLRFCDLRLFLLRWCSCFSWVSQRWDHQKVHI